MKTHRAMRLCACWVVIVLACSGLSAPVQAHTSEQHGNLLELDIDHLLTIEIASKRSEQIADAPGIVTVITKADIERFGYRNLRDILDRQTSLQIIGYNLFPHNKAAVRGVATNPADNSVLISLNGRPIREPAVSSINHDIYELFPISVIEKIEIIRGPGSVLYGTNAFSGVINIITKKSNEADAAELATEFTAGSFDTQRVEIYGGGEHKDLSVYGALNYSKSDGGEFENVTDDFGKQGNYPFGHKGEQAVVWAKYKDVTLNAMFSDSNTENIRGVLAFPATEHIFKRQYFDLGYRIPVSSNWYVDTNVTYQTHRSESVTEPPPVATPRVNHSTNWMGEITAHNTHTDTVQILLGAAYSRTTPEGELDFVSESTQLYGQIHYFWLPNTKLIAGAQYTKPDATNSHLSPRVGVIYHFNDRWGTKALYSSAFREPSAVERFVSSPVIQGDAGLEPESIDTLDLQLFYYHNANSLALTYFHSKQQEVITLQGALPTRSVNLGEITYEGIELEGRYSPNEKWLFTGNATYQTHKDKNGNEDVTFSPDLMIKWGVAYDQIGWARYGLFYSYFAASVRQNTMAIYLNEAADDYQLVTANISSNLGELFNQPVLNNMRADLYIDNLLNETIYFPLMRDTIVSSIPHHAGRGAYLSVTLDFL